MDWQNVRDAIETRIVAAHVAATTVDPTIVLIRGLRNRKEETPSPALNYLRAYWRRSDVARLSQGSRHLQRLLGAVFVAIMLKHQTGDDLVFQIVTAISPSFATGPDTLEFETPSQLGDPYLSGEHWLTVVSFPFSHVHAEG